MRTLKFRVWDEEKKKYCTEYDAMTLKPDGEFYIERGWCIISGGFEVEQYTGLKDKNGKEIYEGDIVKARWYRAKNARLDTKGEVKFNDGWFYIKDDPDGQDRLGVPVHNCYNIEVIGNIHESPELVGGEE